MRWLIVIFVFIASYTAYRNYNGNAATHPLIVSVKSLSDDEVDNLTQLGLTVKAPVNITNPVTHETTLIHGRFLHITDIHPDPYYKVGSSPGQQCHSGGGGAGKYGDAVSGCDAPIELMNASLAWIEENLKDKIDFIVWTGDNVRHDNDRRYPRTEQHIFDLNDQVSKIMFQKFGSKLIPSLGNNDVYPHNLFAPGPTLQTRELYKTWQPFIPQLQFHIFNRGAYFFQEVIPNKLAVLSINTLYLFQSNPLVDNCNSKKQPGYKLFEWLGVVLKEMRKRNMKIWLSGHVPPNEKNYDISCLTKYIIWSYEYRDIIIGGLYGHMNIDHFIPLDSVQAYKTLSNSVFVDHEGDELISSNINDQVDFQRAFDYYNMSMAPYLDPEVDFKIRSSYDTAGGIPNNKVGYMTGLRSSLYASVKGKKKSGAHSERYSIAHVNPSIVPTFNSGIRVWEYNITGLEESLTHNVVEPWDAFFKGLNVLAEEQDKYHDEKKKTKGKKDHSLPPKKPKDLPLGPAYTPQIFTPERYVQYYADLESINAGEKPFKFEIEYTTDDEVFRMKTLTVDEWVKFSRKLGKLVKLSTQDADDHEVDIEKKKKKDKKKHGDDKELQQLEKIWSHYLKYSFVSSNYENMGYG